MDPTLSISPDAVATTAVSVLLPLPLIAPYDYLVPADLAVGPGSYVEVPLGARQATGVVWGPARGDVNPEKLREISAVLDLPPMPDNLRQFVDWVASYTLARLGTVLRMTMSVPKALSPIKPVTAYRIAPAVDMESESLPGGVRLTDARRRVLGVLADGKLRKGADLARMSGSSPAVIRGMADTQVLEQIALTEEEPVGRRLARAVRTPLRRPPRRLAFRSADVRAPPQLARGALRRGKAGRGRAFCADVTVP